MKYERLTLAGYQDLLPYQQQECDMINRFIKPDPRLKIRRRFRKLKLIEPKYTSLIDMTLEEYLHWSQKDKINRFYFENPAITFKTLYGIKERKVGRVNYYNAISISKWINNELLFIRENERKAFDSRPDPELTKAGIHRLNIFGNYNLISQLTNGELTKEEEILSIPYSRCLQYVAKKRIEAEIQRDLTDNQKQGQ